MSATTAAVKGALRSLTVEGFGLIERTATELGAGLNVFTGETGSGKSMVIDALGFAFGDRGGADIVRTGAARAAVFVELDVDDPTAAWLAENSFAGDDPDEGAPLVISREVTAQGRSSARINGRPATATQLRELGDIVLDIVGQHEHQQLLMPARHLALLDAFAGQRVVELRAECARAHGDLAAVDAALAELREQGARHERLLADARFAAREIAAAALVDGELERLHERRTMLANSAKIAQAIGNALERLDDADRGAVIGLGHAAKAMDNVASYGEKLAAAAQSIRDLQAGAQEVAASITELAEEGAADAGDLESVADRIALIEDLIKKYGGSAADVIAAGARFAEQAETLERRDEETARLEKARRAHSAALEDAAAKLTKERVAAAQTLQSRVQEELRELAIPGATFRCAVDARPAGIGAGGADRVEFFAALNPDEPERPIAKSASGGELSRLLLALKMAFAHVDPHPVVVLDEIDAGVGGAAARRVGSRIDHLAKGVQVLCVTHLAQIAVFADTHIALTKNVRKGKTFVEANRLTERAQIRTEIARMLAGDEQAAEALRHADALLRETRPAAKS
jgi:DNA repair protein RecN (Recombination protein N)